MASEELSDEKPPSYYVDENVLAVIRDNGVVRGGDIWAMFENARVRGQHGTGMLAAHLLAARARIAELTEARDKADANYRFMVERAADQKLDGYRELGARAAAAENRADTLERDLAAAREKLAEAWDEGARASSAVYPHQRVFDGNPYRSRPGTDKDGG